jgi:GT2 family glycosyltransferase
VEGLKKYDIVGCVGASRFPPWLPVWTTDEKSCRGKLLQGQKKMGQISYTSVTYGDFGPVVVIDGFLMAFKALVFDKIKFDERYGFHCYDVDFCMQAIEAGLRIGVIDMGKVYHESSGSYGSKAWVEEVRKFISKWKDKLEWVEVKEEV